MSTCYSPQSSSNVSVKKCSYFLAIIKREHFIKLGAKYTNNFYVIQKNYDGSSTGETCALIGINKIDVINLIYNTEKFLPNITTSDYLQHVESLEKLSIKLIENTIKYFSKYIVNLADDDLLLFNIEPKGQTKRQLRFYPNPNMSIPGGNMEKIDNYCIEKCGEREFYEETGIDITDNYEIIARNKLPLLKMYTNDNLEGKTSINNTDLDETENKQTNNVSSNYFNSFNGFRLDNYYSNNHHKKNYSISFPNYSSIKKMNDKAKRTIRIEKYFFLIRIL
jgi:hypothetical protein